MLSSALLLMSVASVSSYMGPRPEETVVIKNWITGCDNNRDCSAAALHMEADEVADNPEHLEIFIEQGSGHQLDPVVTIKMPFGDTAAATVVFDIDADVIALPELINHRYVFGGEHARALLQKMRVGTWARIRNRRDSRVARASLSGLTASLLRIDEQQGKVGTPSALARPGKRRPVDDLPGYSVSLHRPPRSDQPPTAPNPEAMAKLNTYGPCANDEDTSSPFAHLVRLDANNSMIVAPWRCGNGAYRFYANIMIVDGFGALRPATFDYDNGITGDGSGNVLVNAAWDESKRALESHDIYRAVGDCGRVDQFIWDGARFRLSEQRAMPECRGSVDRIRIWKLQVLDR